ncbi:UNKNOWN [Stylonychia lemnae]|uniref:Methyltransferase domain-containing protein n=1 Tax=Stylonychia lemnae TaxID=5949 RepID=A0A078AU89_STYLE|nr:UNKNOWN [Stylonychia lemnae]|eukprot:CDW84807.1 UNKNOWN [Stylonychia lemnae]
MELMRFDESLPESPSRKRETQEQIDDTYAQIVEKYKKSKLIPWRKFVETPSFMNLVGQLTNEDVIDLACGEGFYTRKMREMTQGKVFGLDYCENFIKMAKWQLNDSDDIDYRQADCSLPISGIPYQFDLVTPTFLLQNAVTEERFEQMIRNIWNLCKPGGRVCGMGSSPKVPADALLKEHKYGRSFTTDPDTYFKRNSSKYIVRIEDKDADLDISLVLYWYSAEHYENIFKKLGFINFRWVEMELFEDTENQEYWKDFMDGCSLIMYEAFKPMNAN